MYIVYKITLSIALLNLLIQNNVKCYLDRIFSLTGNTGSQHIDSQFQRQLFVKFVISLLKVY